jgi:hypothetical protein
MISFKTISLYSLEDAEIILKNTPSNFGRLNFRSLNLRVHVECKQNLRNGLWESLIENRQNFGSQVIPVPSIWSLQVPAKLFYLSI